MSLKLWVYNRFSDAVLDGKSDEIRNCVTADFRAQIPGGAEVGIDGFIEEILSWQKLLPGLGQTGRMISSADEGDTLVACHELTVTDGNRRISLTMREVVRVRKGKIAQAIILFDDYGTTAQRIASDAPVSEPPRRRRGA